jgi:hypothetical protein
MPDRLARGIWPHPPLRFPDLVQILADCLRNSEWFPDQWRPPQKGQLVREGGNIERLGTDRYLYRAQSSNPLDPTLVTHSGEVLFTNAEDAASHYLIWDLHLPGDLDGWKVID